MQTPFSLASFSQAEQQNFPLTFIISIGTIFSNSTWQSRQIYHLTNNPYKFPKNNGSADFIPLPKRFAEIITEFKAAIQEQKDEERPETERTQAQTRINEIYSEIKALIQSQITASENSFIIFTPEILFTEQEKQTG
ncbi:2940_t:CDS:2 [Funneliformis geosporum]|uniref:2940_t:CDS:1 n=1 Tax=Funneliformis geosporum TaxID=1117311 RepID=A0A9W4SAS4_9GLOM|nr:2940_t:CDS:2 [Funneliformis geosporum]